MTEQNTRARAASLLEEKQLPTDQLRHMLLQLGTNLAGPATPEQLVRIIIQSSRPERVCEYVERLSDSSSGTPKKGGPTFQRLDSQGETKAEPAAAKRSEAAQPQRKVSEPQQQEVVEPPKSQVSEPPKEVAPPPPKPRPEPVAREISEQYILPVAPESSQPQPDPSKSPEAPTRRLEDSLSESPVQIKSFPQGAGLEFEAFSPVSGTEVGVETAASLVAAATSENPDLGIAETPVAVDYPETPLGTAFPETPLAAEFSAAPLSMEFSDAPLSMGSASSEGYDTLGDSAEAEEAADALSQEQRKSEVYLSELDRMRRISAGSQTSQVSLTGVEMPIHLSEEERLRRASDVERAALAAEQGEPAIEEEESEESKKEAAARSKLVMAQADLERVQRMQAKAEEVVASERDARASRRASIDLAVELAEQERQRRISEQATEEAPTAAEAQRAGALTMGQQELERLTRLQDVAESERQMKAERRRSIDLAVELAEAERQRRIAEEFNQPPKSEDEDAAARPTGRKGIASLISKWNSSGDGGSAAADTLPRKLSATSASTTTPRPLAKAPPPPPRPST